MNIKAFKKLIKEAVVDAIHEELPEILNEHMARQNRKVVSENKTMNFTSDDVSSFDPSSRKQLHEKMGSMFGFQPQQYQSSVPLEVIRDQVDKTTGEPVNPYLAFLVDSAQNMTPQEKAGLKNLG